jgi:fumarylacetoacetase
MNGKSFGTSMSPWIITLDALAPFETTLPPRDIPVTSYLKDSKPKATYDIHLQADLVADGLSTTVCKSELKWMYWSLRDLVAQQTVNGCNLNTGDVLATGTISGSTEDSHGCLLELTKGGGKPFILNNGEERMFLKDGDSIRLTATAGDGVGFGECFGAISSLN